MIIVKIVTSYLFLELRGYMEEVETMKAERDVVESELKALNDPSASSNMRETFLKVMVLSRGTQNRFLKTTQ